MAPRSAWLILSLFLLLHCAQSMRLFKRDADETPEEPEVEKKDEQPDEVKLEETSDLEPGLDLEAGEEKGDEPKPEEIPEEKNEENELEKNPESDGKDDELVGEGSSEPEDAKVDEPEVEEPVLDVEDEKPGNEGIPEDADVNPEPEIVENPEAEDKPDEGDEEVKPDSEDVPVSVPDETKPDADDVPEEPPKEVVPDCNGINCKDETPFIGGFVFDSPFFSFEQVENYFRRLERAMEQIFSQTMAAVGGSPDTYENTTERVIIVDGRKYRVHTTVFKGGNANNAVAIEAVSIVPTYRRRKRSLVWV